MDRHLRLVAPDETPAAPLATSPDVRPAGEEKWKAPHQMKPGDWLAYEASTIEEISPQFEGKRNLRLRSGRTVSKREGQLCRVVPEA